MAFPCHNHSFVCLCVTEMKTVLSMCDCIDLFES